MVVGRTTYNPSASIHGLILIDCWDYTNMPSIHDDKAQQLSYFYRNLINRVQQFDIKYVVNAMTHSDTNCIDPIIKQEILDCHSTAFIVSWDEFLDIAMGQLDRSVANWYVAGQTWQLCVHNNSIGLETMSKSKDFTFYADEFSFLKNPAVRVDHEDFKADHLEWQFHSGFGYQLWRTV
jgi:hypothetical protein